MNHSQLTDLARVHAVADPIFGKMREDSMRYNLVLGVDGIQTTITVMDGEKNLGKRTCIGIGSANNNVWTHSPGEGRELFRGILLKMKIMKDELIDALFATPDIQVPFDFHEAIPYLVAAAFCQHSRFVDRRLISFSNKQAPKRKRYYLVKLPEIEWPTDKDRMHIPRLLRDTDFIELHPSTRKEDIMELVSVMIKMLFGE